jgi:hypothetical protein
MHRQELQQFPRQDQASMATVGSKFEFPLSIRSRNSTLCKNQEFRTVRFGLKFGAFERPAATLEFELSDAAVTRFVGARQAVLL